MKKRAFTLIELFVLIAILAILGCMVTGVVKKIFHRGSSAPATSVHVTGSVQVGDDQTAYGGWVKLTGNPKNLTFQEWRELKNQGLLK